MDRGRHSLDIPLSKTIVALRRVRSLRDPSTSSMNKFTALANNVDWDTQSCNEGFGVRKGESGFAKENEECGLRLVESLLRTKSSARGTMRIDGDLNVDDSVVARISGRKSSGRQHDTESSASVSSREMGYDDKVLVHECSHENRNGVHRSRTSKLKESKVSGNSKGICFPLSASNSNPCSPYCYSLGHDCRYSPFVSERENCRSGQRLLEHNSKIVKALDKLEVDVSNGNRQHSPLSECNGTELEPGIYYSNYSKSSRRHIVKDFECEGGSGCCSSRGSLKFANKCFPHLCRCGGLSSGQLRVSSASNSPKLRKNVFDKASISETSSPWLPLLSTNHVSKCLCSHHPLENPVFDAAEDHSSVDARSIKHGLTDRYQNHKSVDTDVPRSFCHKFRPKCFDELVGQTLVVQSLKNAILKNKVAPFYLFHGPHGTGKTSTARVFSAALNCLSKEELRPCGSCLECVALSSGQSEDIHEIDMSKAKLVNGLKSFLKHATVRVPVMSRYKIFILDDCHLLQGDQLTEILRCLKELPRNVLFIFITTDPDLLHRAFLSGCQRHQFSKIKSKDITDRLYRLCVQESLDFDKAALTYIACKSNGSLLDAEAMLEQLALLGQRITVTVVHEFTGVISEDELVDLLDMALSADTCNTVRRARELMQSRVDPMVLVSQLANLVMDILAGWRQWGTSGSSRKFFQRPNLTEDEIERLRNSLKILSDTEEQLRVSKNQTTWLTVALLQFSSMEPSSTVNFKNEWMCQALPQSRDDNLSCSSFPIESSRNSHVGATDINEAHTLEFQSNSRNLDAIWRRALSTIMISSLKDFLEKEGRLSSIYVDKGLVIAELQFRNRDQVLMIEEFRNHITNALTSVLGCDMEIRITVVSDPSMHVNATQAYKDELKKKVGDDNNSNTPFPHGHATPGSKRSRNKLSKLTWCCVLPRVKTLNSKKVTTIILHSKEISCANKDLGGSIHGDVAGKYQKIVKEEVTNGPITGNGFGQEVMHHESQCETLASSKAHRGCFSMVFKVGRKSQPSDNCYSFDTKTTFHKTSGRSDPREASFNAYLCADGSSLPSSGSLSQVTFTNKSTNQEKMKKASRKRLRFHCCKIPKFPIRKVGKNKRHRQWRSRFITWVVHCTPSE